MTFTWADLDWSNCWAGPNLDAAWDNLTWYDLWAEVRIPPQWRDLDWRSLWSGYGAPEIVTPTLVSISADLRVLEPDTAQLPTLVTAGVSAPTLVAKGGTPPTTVARPTGITVTSKPPPTSTLVAITRVTPTLDSFVVDVVPVAAPPVVGIPVYYGPTDPGGDGPFFWINSATLDPVSGACDFVLAPGP